MPRESDIKTHIDELSEYESQGYNLTHLRSAKESMLENLDKASLAIEIRDFARKIYGRIYSDKTPLAELSYYFYLYSESVSDWAEKQIEGLQSSIESNNSYIESLTSKKPSTSNTKSIELWKSVNDKHEQDITRIRILLKSQQ